MKKYLSMFLAISVCLNILLIPAVATDTITDQYLLSLGVPYSILSTMSESQKALIISTVGSDARYVSYTREDYTVSNSTGELQARGTIDSSELTLSVAAFAITVNGESMYAIYPSFAWNGTVSIVNDAFGFALYPGWEVVPGEENLRIHQVSTLFALDYNTDYDPVASSYSGYGYEFSTHIVALTTCEGNAYIRARDTTGTSTHAITMSYAYNTALTEASFSIAVGPASISLSSTSSSVDYMTGNYSFN